MDHLLVLLLLSSDPVRQVDGTSPCSGGLEVKSNQWWSSMCDATSTQTLKKAAVNCRQLDCGSAVSVGRRTEFPDRSVWIISSSDITPDSSRFILDLTCLNSVRLVNGTSLCSGRLEVKSNQSNHRWSSVCEADFDQQDAEVVCRELGCGAPSVLQGALYGEVEAPKWTKEFQCGGNETSLLDCRSSDLDRNKFSPGRAVGLTCLEPVRMVGEDSPCAGILEVKHNGDWRPVHFSNWTMKEAAAACRELDCGSAVSVGERAELSQFDTWLINSECVQSGSLRECATSDLSSSSVNLTCSKLLLQPKIFISSSTDRVSEARQQGLRVTMGSDFTISCSIKPQYPGGSFQLSFTSYNSAHNYTQPAVNHSARFRFPAAEPTHQGSYSCVYNLDVFSHNFSSESRQLSLTVLGKLTVYMQG
ncbi:scavenger receptor cysteine-rich type 1 protein M130-like [Centropristis striata]|uniref:scavenger receptor cysteine-rich type 1 protein M130-like n=1 Tax=Centropristis striata TaxID=184440 RepID=UPI0027E17DDA|nr:scavenger receptor cysteine-rich type 1 protein M130-like [Centropristis striata]